MWTVDVAMLNNNIYSNRIHDNEITMSTFLYIVERNNNNFFCVTGQIYKNVIYMFRYDVPLTFFYHF